MIKERDMRILIVCMLFTILFSEKKAEANTGGLIATNEDGEFWQIVDSTRYIKKNFKCERQTSYVCEEPWHMLSPESEDEKMCNFRNMEYPEQIYRWVAGWACLGYTHNHLFAAGFNNINMNSRCRYGEQTLPCLELAKENGTCGCFPFDPVFDQVTDAINSAMVPVAQGRWERCYYEAEDCCSELMGQSLQIGEDNVQNENDLYCPATFDGWTCWPPTVPNTVATEVCTEFAYSNTGPSCHHYSTKPCYANGTWEIQTDYTTCSISTRLVQRYQYHMGILGFSIAACLPAVFVFFFYKRLRVTRVILHRNLLIAIVLRNVAVIISRSEIYIDELTNSTDTVMSIHTIACRVLAIFERVAANAVFVCMMIEGVYLHRMIVAVFKRKLNINILYAIGAVTAIAPVIAWSIVMGFLNDHSCWVVYTVSKIQWILDAPRVAILLINTVLFVDILRVLLTTKMRNAESTNQLNTTKATLFLMPLFGSQFLLTALRPGTTNCSSEQIYYFITYTVEGLQGFIVAMLYCYVNKEVHNLVKLTYRKTESAVVSRVRNDTNHRRSLFEPSSARRMTYSTYCEQEPQIRTAKIITLEPEESFAEVIEAVETARARYVNSDKGSLIGTETDSGIVPNGSGEDLAKYTINSSSDNPNVKQNFENVTYENQPAKNDILAYDNPSENNDANITDLNIDEFRKHFLSSDAEKIQTEAEGEIEDTEFLDKILHILDSSTKIDDEIELDPNVLSPNRSPDDKILFV